MVTEKTLHNYCPKEGFYITPIIYFCPTYIKSSDCHPNPGPIKYPCEICGKACKWSRAIRSIACTGCEKWYHKNCLQIKTVIYEPLEQSDASWYCCNCGLPNFNTSLFEDFEIHTYSLSSNLNETSTSMNDSIQSTTNIGPPQCTSSPTKQNKCPVNKKSLRLLDINFQSMKAKREEFWSMLEYNDPDIIIASETWLKPEKKKVKYCLKITTL
jgi:hypothetical protein